MARTMLTKQAISPTGLTPVLSAANASGHVFEGSGNVYLEVRNSDAATRQITIETPATLAGLDVADRVITIPALTGVLRIGPFDPRAYNRPAGGTDAGLVYVNFSAVTGVTCGLFGF